jgi:hypothetical protein
VASDEDLYRGSGIFGNIEDILKEILLNPLLKSNNPVS